MPKKLTHEEFLKRVNAIHKGKYIYPEEYQGTDHKIKIICPQHGEFYLTPHLHMNGLGCKLCNKRKPQNPTKKKWDTQKFINEAVKIHGNKYDYSKVEYVNNHTKVCIICPEHGEFWQMPPTHLKGHGCIKCGRKISSFKKKLTKDEFIKRAKEIHYNKYDYSQIVYESFHKKIKIICPKHGEFLQTPAHHLSSEGCPYCRNSLCENYLINLFESNNIQYEKEKSFKWLKYKSLLLIDFYLPQYNVAIECQGGQHVMPVRRFGGDKSYVEQVKKDRIKYNLCLNNGLKIIYLFEKQFKSKCVDIMYKNAIFYKELKEITINKILDIK